ncbi:MAG: hypothetical protein OHK0015_11620 [Chloroflexi bacterium OHK40]
MRDDPFNAPRLCRVVAFVLVFVLLGGSALATGPTRQQHYLPLVGTGGSRGIFGLELTRIEPSRGLDGVVALAPGWVRRGALSWSEVEPTPGTLRWDTPAIQALDAELMTATRLGLRVVLVIHGSPAWAVAPYRANCAPIAPEHFQAFASFVQQAVARYSAPPYNVRYWEIGNEPDAFVFDADAPFGCWGQKGETFYGGEAFGELLKVVYPAVKRANPSAQVIHGGLLLDRPYDPVTGEGQEARFIEGVLEAGAGDSFDILAYHSYSYYNGNPDGTLSTQDWKPGYLRGILARYGLEKPLFNTESALLCLEPSDACAQAQADAMGRLYVRALRDGIMGYIWYVYDSDSFRSTALVEPDQPTVRRPAFYAFAQARAALDDHRYHAAISGLPDGVEAHQLIAGSRTTIVLWANQATKVRLELGTAQELRCTEADSTPIACASDGSTLELTALPGPRYVNFRTP